MGSSSNPKKYIKAPPWANKATMTESSHSGSSSNYEIRSWVELLQYDFDLLENPGPVGSLSDGRYFAPLNDKFLVFANRDDYILHFVYADIFLLSLSPSKSFRNHYFSLVNIGRSRAMKYYLQNQNFVPIETVVERPRLKAINVNVEELYCLILFRCPHLQLVYDSSGRIGIRRTDNCKSSCFIHLHRYFKSFSQYFYDQIYFIYS